MRLQIMIIIFFAMGLLACSTSKDTKTKKVRYSRDLISFDEIQNSTAANNAYDLIKNKRPQWLRGRGTKSFHNQAASSPVVYVNESRHGDLNSLSSISINNIKEIKFLNAGDATNRYGINHASGAILVTLF